MSDKKDLHKVQWRKLEKEYIEGKSDTGHFYTTSRSFLSMEELSNKYNVSQEAIQQYVEENKLEGKKQEFLEKMRKYEEILVEKGLQNYKDSIDLEMLKFSEQALLISRKNFLTSAMNEDSKNSGDWLDIVRKNYEHILKVYQEIKTSQQIGSGKEEEEFSEDFIKEMIEGDKKD